MMLTMAGRRSDSDARETRLTILRQAADIGSVEGLRGITIGRLATDLGMSKAGVVGQFGSKEALQLATIELASEMFREAVWAPVETSPRGSPGCSRCVAAGSPTSRTRRSQVAASCRSRAWSTAPRPVRCTMTWLP